MNNSAMKSARRITNPVAVRRFRVVGDPDREVVLTIGKPRPDPKLAGYWTCSILVEGIPNERRRRVRGADAVQALQMALECARREIDASGLPVTWAEEPGELYLPFYAPTEHGFPFQRRIERYIKRQQEEVMGAVTATLQERARRRAARREAPSSK